MIILRTILCAYKGNFLSRYENPILMIDTEKNDAKVGLRKFSIENSIRYSFGKGNLYYFLIIFPFLKTNCE